MCVCVCVCVCVCIHTLLQKGKELTFTLYFIEKCKKIKKLLHLALLNNE